MSDIEHWTKPLITFPQVSDLQDASGNSLNGQVEVGDTLLFVDGKPIEHVDIDSLEKFIFGERDSLVTISLKAGGDSDLVTDLTVKRHVLVRSFDTCRRSVFLNQIL